MKLYKKLSLGIVACLSLVSCNDWLDINQNPNTPASEDAAYYYRLPWCQFYLEHGYMITASNVDYYCGLVVGTNTREGGATKWNFSVTNRAANCQQWFFVPCGSNLQAMYDDAMAAGAYHYAAVAKYMRAFGFMEMVDIFGEIPYEEALTSSIVAPAYNTGKEVFLGCVSELEEAIELFQRTQEDGAVELAIGDSWNGGSTDKWLKMCYLLKARWLNHLSKKQQGSYKEGKYDPDEILRCLDLAQQSNADNTLIRHTDTNGNTHDVQGWNETVDYSAMFSCVGMNSNYYVSKWFCDLLTNFKNYGVEDPRADKFIPWTRSQKSANSPAEIKWSDDGLWRRSLGVDLQSNILSSSGPFAVSYNAADSAITITVSGEGGSYDVIIPPRTKYCATTAAQRLGDTVYVQVRSGSEGYNGFRDLMYRYDENDDATAISGVFHVRPNTPTVMASYAEACFIRAEVLMRRGDKGGAFNAYKNGIKANIDFVNDQLQTWVGENEDLADCPSFTPMKQEDIENFLNNGIGNAGDITMGHIMTQKMIAMLYSVELWNDMRRHDWDPNVFIGWDKPYEYKNSPAFWDYLPQDKLPRRWGQASYETDYNYANLEAIGSEVPGALELPTDGGAWYSSRQICTLPVWWDSTQE
mgnify:CR=1 FL=1